MNLSERNRNAALSRWKKVREKDLDFMAMHKEKEYLKARILGYLAGDGSVCRKGKRSDIRFYPDSFSLVNSFSMAMREYYNKKPRITVLNNHYLVRVFSKAVCEDLLDAGSLATNDWSVPSLDTGLARIEWLRAFFDSEAYVGKNRISIGCVNSLGISQVRSLLEYFGITSKIYQYTPKNMNWSKTFILVISTKQNILKYREIINFNHKSKREKLEEITQMPRSHNLGVR